MIGKQAILFAIITLAFSLAFGTFAKKSSAEILDYPEEIIGTLVIVGGGEIPLAAQNRFVSAAGGKQAKILIVPTALEKPEDSKEQEKILEPWKKYETETLKIFHAQTKKAANDPKFVQEINNATGCWFESGDQKQLLQRYQGTRCEKAFRDLLNRGGALGGTSFGAAIQSEWTIISDSPQLEIQKGFGWLPGFIIDQQLFQRNRLQRLLAAVEKKSGVVGLGVDENTALVIHGRRMEVLGSSYAVTILGKGNHDEPRIETLKRKQFADLFQLQRAAHARRLTDFPKRRSIPVTVPNGTLFIHGGGGLSPAQIRRFIELAGGPEALIVFVATSEDDPIPPEPSGVKMLKRFGAKNVLVMHTRDRKQANSDEFLKPFAAAKGIWFSGGRQWRFVDAYAGTKSEAFFHQILANGGVIGGSSAGASIQGDYMPRGHPLGNFENMAEGYEQAFRFLPGTAIDQHFFARQRLNDMKKLMLIYPQFLGIGLDEGTAIEVRKNIAIVSGKSKIAFFHCVQSDPNRLEMVELTNGQAYDLLKYRKIELKAKDPKSK